MRYIWNYSILLFWAANVWMWVGCADDAVEVISSYEAAHNNHDVAASMALYSPDIKFQMKDTWTKTGLPAMRELAEWDAALNSRLAIGHISSMEDSIFCRITENNDWFTAIGLENLVHDTTLFVVHDGLIAEIVAYPSPETAAQIGSAIQSLYQFSQATGDTLINELIVNGQFVYSAKAADQWMGLLRRWQTSRHQQ